MKTSIQFFVLALLCTCLTTGYAQDFVMPPLWETEEVIYLLEDPVETAEPADDAPSGSEVNPERSANAYCQLPYSLYTTNITATSATFNWSAVPGATSYSLQYRQAYGNWSYVPGGPFTVTWVTLYGLDPGTHYEWRLQVYCGYGEQSSWSPAVSFYTSETEYCHTPYGLTTYNITSTSATLSWHPADGAVSYTLQWRYPGGSWNYLVKSWTQTWVNIAGLHPNTTYEWRVRSNCYYGHSDWSPPKSFTTLGSGGSCHPPYDLWTTQITYSSAILNWEPVPGAQSYSVQIRQGYGSWNYIPGNPFYGTWASVHNLYPNTHYEWRVRANCGYGYKGYWSYPDHFTTHGHYACEAPHYLVTTNITTTSAIWDWETVSGAVSYTVQWRYPNGTWNTLDGGPFTNSSAHVSGLQPGTIYEWRVRSNCHYYDYSPWSLPTFFSTLGIPCDHPVGLSASNVTDSSATLHWSPVDGALTYNIQYRLPNGNWNVVPGSPVSDTTITLGGLAPGTPYYWRVQANCENGQSGYWSSSASFTTTGMSSCLAPDTTFTTNVTNSKAKLNWSAVPGATGYVIEFGQLNGPLNPLPIGPWPYTYLNISGLYSNTTYVWRVRTTCGNGLLSAWTAIDTFTTLGNVGMTNDFCSNAVTLQVSTTCNNILASNIDATPSSPAPDGNCPTNGYKDVWFKFTMPNVQYPEVTIRTTAGSLGDAVVEVYIGSNCSGLAYLNCEDDNINGNGSLMPVINLQGAPGITVWVRVWGKDGATGTFEICVLDHNSVDLSGDVFDIVIPDEDDFVYDGEALTDWYDPAFTDAVVQVFPNPVTDDLNVIYKQTENSVVTGFLLTDISGKTIQQKIYDAKREIVEFKETLDVSALQPGLYILQIATTAGVHSEKIMVARQ